MPATLVGSGHRGRKRGWYQAHTDFNDSIRIEWMMWKSGGPENPPAFFRSRHHRIDIIWVNFPGEIISDHISGEDQNLYFQCTDGVAIWHFIVVRRQMSVWKSAPYEGDHIFEKFLYGASGSGIGWIVFPSHPAPTSSTTRHYGGLIT